MTDHLDLMGEGLPARIAAHDKPEFPTIVVTVGFNHDSTNVYLEFLGRQFDETALIRITHAFEEPPLTASSRPRHHFWASNVWNIDEFQYPDDKLSAPSV